ncbi:MAG: hypothetical protein V1722_04265 [Candidatus Micrarchaeota archaeon]
MITGGTIKKVSAERMKDGPNQGMNVNIQVKDAKFEGKNKLTVTYSYEINYTPDAGKMTLEGELHFEENDKEYKELKDSWDKTKQFPEKFASDMLTAVTYTCSAVGTLLAFAVNISAPINVPRARLTPVENKTAA